MALVTLTTPGTVPSVLTPSEQKDPSIAEKVEKAPIKKAIANEKKSGKSFLATCGFPGCPKTIKAVDIMLGSFQGKSYCRQHRMYGFKNL